MKHAMRGNTVLKIVCYAYDILVLCRSRADLETMMNIIAKKFENFGLKLAESKTVTMTRPHFDQRSQTEVPHKPDRLSIRCME